MRKLLPLLVLGLCATAAHAQGNYEIQVYGADTVAPKTLMVELHSNFTLKGQTQTIDGVYPTNHQEHETLELTEGINNWSEVGFYVFTSWQNGHGVQWVGDHIRPRVRVPDSWHWPVGVSLSTEVGYQRPDYSPDTWTWEIRPIVDKAIGRWYFAFNPALERTLHGPDVNQGFGFSPAVKVSYDFTKVISAGIRVLRRLRQHHHPLRRPRSAATTLRRHRPQRLPQLGDQLRRRHRPHRRHRPPHRQRHPRPPLQLGQTPRRSVALTFAFTFGFAFSCSCCCCCCCLSGCHPAWIGFFSCLFFFFDNF